MRKLIPLALLIVACFVQGRAQGVDTGFATRLSSTTTAAGDASNNFKLVIREKAPVAASAALAGAGAGNVENGAHLYKIAFVTAEGQVVGAASSTVTVVDKTTNGKVSLSSIPTGSVFVTSRKVYRTLAGGTAYKLLTTIADNTTTTYTDNTADSSLTTAAPALNTTANPFLTYTNSTGTTTIYKLAVGSGGSTLGAATATSLNGNTFTTGTYTLTGVAGKTLTFNKTLTLDGTDSTTMTFPTTSATIARTDAGNAFVGNQTIAVGQTTSGQTDLLINPTTKASGKLLHLQINSTDRFVVFDNGNVTVKNPDSLNVSGITLANDANQSLLLWSAGTGTPNSNLFTVPSSSVIAMGNAAGLRIITYNAAGAISFGTGGFAFANERWRIDSSGNLLTGMAAAPQFIGFGNTSSPDVIISRNSAGSVQIGTTAANASGSLAFTNATMSGKATTYNNQTTAGQGLTTILGVTSQKAETASADANVLTVTPASAVGTYRLHVVISVSAATSGIIGWTATWTDSNGNAQAPTNLSLFQSGAAAPALTFTTSAASNYYGDAIIDINNAGTNIVIKWTGGGTTTAKMSATVERIQ